MEDPYSEETKDFVEKQNKISGPYINSCGKITYTTQAQECHGMVPNTSFRQELVRSTDWKAPGGTSPIFRSIASFKTNQGQLSDY